MDNQKYHLGSSKPAGERLPVWRQALDSVFGAAVRLHLYRDARDVLLGRVMLEQERRVRQGCCCSERC